MKTLFCILIISCQIQIGISQSANEIDSLVTLFKTHNKQDQRLSSNISSKLGWMFQVNRKYDSSLYFYRQALMFPENQSAPTWLGHIHLGTGVTYLHLDQWDSSFFHHEKALAFFKIIDDKANLATTYTNLSILFKNKGLYQEALSSAIQSLTLLNNDTPSFVLASAYNNVGTVHKHIKNYPDANLYYRKALAVRLKLNQPLEIAKSYNNLGELFLLTHQYDSAKHNLSLAASIKRKHNDTQGLARTLTRLGKTSLLLSNIPTARSQLLESLATQRHINDSVGMIETLNILGELYLTTNELPQAKKHLLEANTIIHTSGTPDYLRQNLELQVNLSRRQKDFAKGMELFDELLIIRDSLLNEEKSKSLQAMHIRYETQKKEQEIELLEQREEINHARIESNRILIGSLVAGLTLVVAIGILIYVNLRNARSSKQRIELLLSETRHRIKNNLQTLASIFHLQTRHYTDQAMVFEARSSESRVHTMSLLHEKFYSGEADHVMNTRDYITDLVDKLVDIYGNQTRNLKLLLQIEDIELDIDKALALSLIIQELVCNTFKYAFDHEPNPELSIDIFMRSTDVVAIIHDNGIGIAKSSTATSQGLNLVNALVTQLDGELHIETHPGTTFIIRFPATSLWTKHAFS